MKIPKKLWKARTPTIIQMEATECGAASLAIVLGHYGRFIPLEQLRVECGVSRDGSDLFKVAEVAEAHGLKAEPMQMDLDSLYTVHSPCILFWNYNHFLVLQGFSKKKVFLNDPAFGPRTVTYEELDRAFTGILIALEPGPAFQKKGKPPLLIKEIFHRLRSSSLPMAYLIATSFFLLIPGLSLPVFTRIFVDYFLISPNLAWEQSFIGAILFATLMAGGLTALRQYCLKRFDAQLSVAFSSGFLWHLLRLPVAFYTQRYSGEIAYRMNFNDLVAETLTGPFATTVLDLTLVGFYALFLFLYDVTIGSMAVLALLLNLGVMFWIQRSRRDAYARLQQERGKLASLGVGAIRQIETIKAAGIENAFFGRLSGLLTKNSNAMQEIEKKDALLLNAPLLFQALATAGLITLGGWRVVEGKLTLGMLMALYLLLLSFLQPVAHFIRFAQLVQNMHICLGRLNDALKNPIDPSYQKKGSSKIKKTKLEGFLQFRDVSFGYTPGDLPVIQNLSFDLTPGKRIALVGPSGCGKSTIARLSCFLYRPWEGEIFYDGHPFEEIAPALFQNSIASVDQEIMIFEGTVWDNLTLWNSTITEEMVFQATKDATIHELILSRDPLGYKAPLLEGGRNLSGGQRQLLEIARALVRRPSLLIMDEATSSLDSQTEKIISDNIRRIGCSCLMIAHRLSTIQDCDEIIVLDQGMVVERGTHEQLKKKRGIYRELVESELGAEG